MKLIKKKLRVSATDLVPIDSLKKPSTTMVAKSLKDFVTINSKLYNQGSGEIGSSVVLDGSRRRIVLSPRSSMWTG